MIRKLAIFGLVWSILGAPALASEVSLNTHIVVEDQYLRLGDLFTIQGEKAANKIAYSPQPGKQSVYRVEWLYRVAKYHGVPWRPLSMDTRTTVERASQEINRDEIESVLMDALKEKDIGDKVEIRLNTRNARVFVAAEKPATVGVESLNYDDRSHRVSATLVAPAGDPSAQRFRISGRVYKLVPVPVLSKRVRRGDIIREDDITWKNLYETRVTRDVVVDEDTLAGQEATRSIGPNQPVRASYLRRPQLVKKGSIVTILLQRGQMRLTAQGKSLDNGGKGDTIRIKNKHSKRIIEGEIVGAGTARVASLHQQVAD
jgi:flagella basal body P-ring formation protein FlgA